MNIVADENIPMVHELFSPFGNVVLLPGREMTAEQVQEADALLVRSVTNVNKSLLAGSNIKFVGTATIGTDHIDESYLQENNITFASAPGSNANAVVQYVLSALSRLRPHWQEQTVGIIGCGNVGGRLYKTLKSLGVKCHCYDPFLTAELIADLMSLNEVMRADIICLHTPLTKTGDFPTHHMFDEARLKQLQPGSLLINAGRGAVIDNQALLKLMPSTQWDVVLDVWESEPAVLLPLLEQVSLATPHIAGYSWDGKINGTLMLSEAFCDWSGEMSPVLSPMFDPEQKPIAATSLNQAILASYDICDDDMKMREALLREGANTAKEFDRLRKHYPARLEFNHYQPANTLNPALEKQLKLLGFGAS